MAPPAPNSHTNGDSLGASWGDKTVTAKGSLGLAVLVVCVFAGLIAFAIYWCGNAIRDAGAAVATAQTVGFDKVLGQMKTAATESRAQHDDIVAKQNLANCMNSYDFASRQRLHARRGRRVEPRRMVQMDAGPERGAQGAGAAVDGLPVGQEEVLEEKG
jgi:hypothetical protein